MYLTPEALMTHYPQVKMFGWNASKIGIFFNSGMLIGYHFGKDKKAMILVSSFIELIEFTNLTLSKKQVFTFPGKG